MHRTRDPLLLVGAALLLGVTLLGGVEAVSWIGRPFPGFLLLGNRVVASAGLRDWPATGGGEIYQHQVVAVDRVPLDEAHSLREIVSSLPVGTELRYRFRRGQREFERTIPTRVFSGSDFLLLFGSYLFCGLGLGGTAFAIRYLRGRDAVGRGTAFGLWLVGMYALTALDLYGPYRVFRLHALVECFLFAGGLHMLLVFPQEHRLLKRFPRLLAIPYGAAAMLALVTQVGLHDPALYAATHRIALTAFGAQLLAFIGFQVWNCLRPPSFDAWQRAKVVVIGTLAALTPQVFLVFTSALSGGQAPENTLGWSGVFFPLAIGYALLRQDLFEVDVILRRTVHYAILTGAVAVAYAGAVAGFEALVQVHSPWTRGTFMVLFAVVLVTVLLPLRDRIQSTVDRLFFRSAYDFRRLMETTSARLASAVDLGVITHELERLRELNRDLEKNVEERTSELAEALGELRDTQAQLVHQEKMASLGQLVAGIAHELNNPLNFIQGNIHYLRKYTEALTGSLGDYERVVTECSPDSAAELEKVRSAHRLADVLEDLESAFAGCEEGVERTTTLVKNLRTFSRLDLAELSRVNLHEALESTLSLLEDRLGRIRVVKDYGDIPPVECLGSQLNQVFMNLLSNALDAVGESGTITLRTRPQGEGRVAIEIEDDGCGIEPEHLGRIFAPFFTTKPVGQGTGLGLAIAYGVLTRHGAEIRVRSELGRGACFELELPVEFPQPDDAGEASSGL
jgi:signal transduction histidine kinase